MNRAQATGNIERLVRALTILQYTPHDEPIGPARALIEIALEIAIEDLKRDLVIGDTAVQN